MEMDGSNLNDQQSLNISMTNRSLGLRPIPGHWSFSIFSLPHPPWRNIVVAVLADGSVCVWKM